MSILFVVSMLLVAWTFVGYPACAVALARKRSIPEDRGTGSTGPGVTVVVAARNESSRIRQRIENLLASDYPAQLLRVLIVDDGSSDNTAELVSAMDDGRLALLRLPCAVGKSAALNRALERVDTPLTVFADSRQLFEPTAIARLAAAFADPAVGLAAGRLELGQGESTSLYWRIETALRKAESRLGWAHGASGAIYAIRTPLFTPLPEGLLLDDVWTPLNIARRGHRLVFVDDAIATEPATLGARAEFRRKLRTLSGNWQLIAHAPWLLDPRRNRLFLPWVSHKLLRLIAPWALAAALIASFLAVLHSAATWLQIAFWLQLAAYGAASMALATPAFARRVPLATAAGSFLLLNFAAMMALPAWLGNRRPDRFWKR